MNTTRRLIVNILEEVLRDFPSMRAGQFLVSALGPDSVYDTDEEVLEKLRNYRDILRESRVKAIIDRAVQETEQ